MIYGFDFSSWYGKRRFDWPYCEHALTVGYRSSLTEIIQIIEEQQEIVIIKHMPNLQI